MNLIICQTSNLSNLENNLEFLSSWFQITYLSGGGRYTLVTYKKKTKQEESHDNHEYVCYIEKMGEKNQGKDVKERWKMDLGPN